MYTLLNDIPGLTATGVQLEIVKGFSVPWAWVKTNGEILMSYDVGYRDSIDVLIKKGSGVAQTITITTNISKRELVALKSGESYTENGLTFRFDDTFGPNDKITITGMNALQTVTISSVATPQSNVSSTDAANGIVIGNNTGNKPVAYISVTDHFGYRFTLTAADGGNLK